MKAVLLFVGLLVASAAHATKFVQWQDGAEITVPVYEQIAEDKKIKFPEPVALGVTRAFKQYYRYQNIGSVIYLKPVSPGKTPAAIRVMAKGQKTQNTYILMVRKSSAELDAEPVEVLVSANTRSTDSYLPRNGLLSQKPEVTPVQLVRYASQQFYAPKYAIEPVAGVRMAPLDSDDNYDFLYPSNALSIRPIAAFTSGAFTVTALSVENKSSHLSVEIHKELFASRVNGVGVVTQHPTLGVTERDNRSAVYIVTHGDLRTNLKVGGVQ